MAERRVSAAGRPLTASEKHIAVMGLGPDRWEAWKRWDDAVGPWFRERHGLVPFWPGDADRLEREPAPPEPWPLPAASG